MRLLVVIPTFEPSFEPNEQLEAYYRVNFDAWLRADGAIEPHVLFSDFKSSEAYREFLRRYADEYRGRVSILEGAEPLGSFQAFNVAIRSVDYDLVVWAASDTRPRDGAWVSQVMADFADPDVVAVIPTATEDGAACLPQTQQGALDRASMRVELPRFFQLVVGVFHRRMLEPFSHRLCDRLKDMGNEKGVMWQAEAVGGKVMLNHRFNVIHERYYDSGRYNWKAATHTYRRDRSAESAFSRAASAFLPAPGGWVQWQEPVLEDLRSGWREKGLRGIARVLYIRWRRNPVFYILKMRTMPYTDFVPEKLAAGHQLKAFRALDPATRIALVEALYMGAEQELRGAEAVCVKRVPS